MNLSYDTLLQQALALPEAERENLVHALIPTLPDSEPDSLHPEWAEEIKRRTAEYDAGLVQGTPWAQVRDDARRRLPTDA
jgi:putative addiction module component (TIGR02574 family)